MSKLPAYPKWGTVDLKCWRLHSVTATKPGVHKTWTAGPRAGTPFRGVRSRTPKAYPGETPGQIQKADVDASSPQQNDCDWRETK